MHYSNLNQKDTQGSGDDFRPQDFLDLDSGDSDNEILAKFRPEKPQQPATIKQFVPSYLNQNNSGIEEHTGYSNSPKFSVYRLNNQSHLKDGPAGFEDHLSQLQQQNQPGDQSQLFEAV